jgi:glutaconate CoA-transferase subunit A
MTIDAFLEQVQDGMTLVIGGAGLNRKPMALLEAIAGSDVKELRIVSWVAGPDVDVLLRANKVRELVYGYVGFDAFGLAPRFRAARQDGTVRCKEWSEYLVIAALEAGSRRLPFMPVRSGLGTGVLANYPEIELIEAPYTGERLVAVPAIRPDIALIHANQADERGHCRIDGEPYVDRLAARAAEKTFVSVERIGPHAGARGSFIAAPWVDGVIPIPGGASFTSCFPEYPLDVIAVQAYLYGPAKEGA